MKLKDIYRKVIEEGMSVDPRGVEVVEKQLERTKKRYEKMDEEKKENFDEESLTNPYPDTRILYGDEDTEVKGIMVGIDIDNSEILLGDKLRDKGEQIDLLISHHPRGIALLNLFKVMDMQSDILKKLGIPINIAEGILDKRISEVKRNLLPVNVNKTVDTARILDFPFMCTHTPADNHVTTHLQSIYDEEKPDTLGDVMDILKDIPEYKDEKKKGSGNLILCRSIKSESNPYKIRAGKVFVDMTGGTGGSKEAFEKLAQQSDVGTIVGMHLGEEHRKMANKYHINVIIAGHMASDTLGMNLMIDKFEAEEKLNIVSCSGFNRISRLK